MFIEPESLDVGHGVGGGNASINNAAFSVGAFGGWESPSVAAFINGQAGWTVARFDKHTGVVSNVFTPPVSANAAYAGGGVIAAFNAGTGPDHGLHATTGLRLPDGGLLGVGPDGAIGYKPSYQSNGPSRVREVNGDDWQLTPGHAGALQLLGDRCAIWLEGFVVGVAGLPPPHYVSNGGIWNAQAAFAGGEWWICYYSGKHGIVLHPFVSSLYCYAVLPKGDGWHKIAASGVDGLRITIARHEGEPAGDIWGYDLNVRTGLVTPLVFSNPPLQPTTLPWVETASINAPPIEPPIKPIDPVDPIDPPVEPPIKPIDPPIHPLPPKPKPYHTHTKGATMIIDKQTVVLRGPGGKLGRPDAPNTGTWADLGKGWRGMIWDGSDVHDARYHHVAQLVENKNYALTSKASNGLAGADSTKYSGSIPEQFYYKPDGNQDRGGYETWRVYDGNENGALMGVIEFTTEDGKFFSCAVAIEVVA